MELEDAQAEPRSSLHRVIELVATMNIGLLIPPVDGSSTQPSSSMVSETGQTQPPTESGAFSILLNDAVKQIDDPIEPVLPTAVDGHATEAVLIDIAGVACSRLCVQQEVATPMAAKAELLLSDPTELNGQSLESMLLIPQGVAEAASHDDGTLGDQSVSVALPQAGTADSYMSSSLQSRVDPAQVDEASAMAATPTVSRTQDEPPIRNGRGAPANFAPAPPEQPLGESTFPGTLAPVSLTSNQKPIVEMEQQRGGNLSSATYLNGNAQSFGEPSPGNRPATTVQDQGESETVVPGQSLPVRLVGGSRGGGQDPFGGSAQGGGEGATFHSSGSETPESGIRGTQSTLFSDLSTAARHTQSLPAGIGTSVSTAAADQLKLAQAFLGENHSATMTAPRGTAQTVQVELPSQEAGPLSVRISMMDQTVHTQFTTDRSDLGAILIGRQDQLQQNLIKSGLELGQFQVHINQEGRQEAFSDRQSRRHGGATEQQPASQGHNQEAQDGEWHNHRLLHALSLFA
ncbi:MAG: flagellar hook-length control protein FliK [Nitrospirae bacterium]|nr:flagellar hook-length control protein FliK [Nitrospirota bacterium]